MIKVSLSLELSLSKVLLGFAGVSAAFCTIQYFATESKNNVKNEGLTRNKKCRRKLDFVKLNMENVLKHFDKKAFKKLKDTVKEGKYFLLYLSSY